jgi:hypothetical protein
LISLAVVVFVVVYVFVVVDVVAVVVILISNTTGEQTHLLLISLAGVVVVQKIT